MLEDIPRTSVEELVTSFIPACRPAIVTGIPAGWRTLADWTPRSIVAACPDQKVLVAVSAAESGRFDYGTERRTFRYKPMMLSEAGALIEQQTPGARYYIMQRPFEETFPALKSWITIPEGIPGTKTPIINVWLGSGGNVTPLHYDVWENMFVHLYGVKTVTVFAPAQTRYLYQYPPSAELSHLSEIDVERVDEQRHPEYRHARGYRTQLQPGEVMYLPAYWWHQVRSESTAVSVNFWWSPRPEQCLVPNAIVDLGIEYAQDCLQRFEDIVLRPSNMDLLEFSERMIDADATTALLCCRAAIARWLEASPGRTPPPALHALIAEAGALSPPVDAGVARGMLAKLRPMLA